MLAEDSAGAEIRGKIILPPINDRFSYHLSSELEDRLGHTQDAQYRLVVTTKLTEQGLAITRNNAVTRRRIFATAQWALYPIGSEKPVLHDRTITQSGYNATSSLYSARVTKEDIERRLAVDLGQRISRTILARASQLEKAGAS